MLNRFQTIRRLEERIRIIGDDLESEQHLRKRIEREKQDLQIQIIHLSERLTEAEGGATNQADINRRRYLQHNNKHKKGVQNITALPIIGKLRWRSCARCWRRFTCSPSRRSTS